MPHVRPSRSPGAVIAPTGTGPQQSSHRRPVAGTRSGPDEVRLRRDASGTGDGVLATRAFEAGETVMVGFLIGPLAGNDSHATQVSATRWARHGDLGPKVNHSCDPNCGVRLNPAGAFDFVARRGIADGGELTFDYAMRNVTIEHFPDACLCGADGCRGTITGWKDLPDHRKDAYGALVAPYLRTMDDDRLAAAGS